MRGETENLYSHHTPTTTQQPDVYQIRVDKFYLWCISAWWRGQSQRTTNGSL